MTTDPEWAQQRFTPEQEEMLSILDALPERAAGILALRFGVTCSKPKSRTEAGRIYGLTALQVRQIEARALFRLGREQSQALRDFRLPDGAPTPVP